MKVNSEYLWHVFMLLPRKSDWRQVILSLYFVKSSTQLGDTCSYIQRIYACPQLSLRTSRLMVVASYEQYLFRRLLFSFPLRNRKKKKETLQKHFVYFLSEQIVFPPKMAFHFIGS